MKKIFATFENGKLVTVSEAESLEFQQYVIPYDLEALTIGQAQQIYKANADDEDFVAFLSGEKEEEVWSSSLLHYARKTMRVMAIVCGMDLEAVEALSDEEVIRFAPNFDLNVLRPLYQFGLYQPRDFDGFDFEGVHYQMPLSTSDGLGGIIPMSETTAEEWAESNDLRVACSYPAEYMHLIVAILCRPEGEAYNEKVARERAEAFKNLPCSVGLDVFFCKLLRMSITASIFYAHLGSLKEKAEKRARTTKPRSGNGSTKYTSQRGARMAKSSRAKSKKSRSGK